jgi:hypothetical protein
MCVHEPPAKDVGAAELARQMHLEPKVSAAANVDVLNP